MLNECLPAMYSTIIAHPVTAIAGGAVAGPIFASVVSFGVVGAEGLATGSGWNYGLFGMVLAAIIWQSWQREQAHRQGMKELLEQQTKEREQILAAATKEREALLARLDRYLQPPHQT